MNIIKSQDELYYKADIIIDKMLNSRHIAVIDKNTRNRIKQMLISEMKFKECSDYYLENLVHIELDSKEFHGCMKKTIHRKGCVF